MGLAQLCRHNLIWEALAQRKQILSNLKYHQLVFQIKRLNIIYVRSIRTSIIQNRASFVMVAYHKSTDKNMN